MNPADPFSVWIARNRLFSGSLSEGLFSRASRLSSHSRSWSPASSLKMARYSAFTSMSCLRSPRVPRSGLAEQAVVHGAAHFLERLLFLDRDADLDGPVLGDQPENQRRLGNQVHTQVGARCDGGGGDVQNLLAPLVQQRRSVARNHVRYFPEAVQEHDLLLLRALSLHHLVHHPLGQVAVQAVDDLAREKSVDPDDDGNTVGRLSLFLVGQMAAPYLDAGDLGHHAHGRLDERIHVFGVDLYHCCSPVPRPNEWPSRRPRGCAPL